MAFNSSGVSGRASSVRYNCVYGNSGYNYSGIDPTGTNGNIRVDPLFVQNPGPGHETGDLHLRYPSPCLDDGNDADAYGSQDVDGSPRIAGLRIDMGAYESGRPHLPGDLNCDGQVNFGDINAFVLVLTSPASYNARYSYCDMTNGDINVDGHVDFGDINSYVALLGGH